MKNTQKSLIAVSGLNTHNLSGEMLEEAIHWRANIYVGLKNPNWRENWDKEGLELLVSNAQYYYEQKTGRSLPYNLAVWGPWVGSPRGRKLWEGDQFSSSSKEEMVEVAARFSSWLKIIADQKLIGLQRLLEKNLDYGMNAKGSSIDPYKLLEVWNSPRTAENMFWKIYKRAWQILEPFGLKPAWEIMGKIMTTIGVTRRVGKVAFSVAAGTVNHFCDGGLTGSSVEILTKARGIKRLKEFSNRGERLNYGSWAVDRVETGEFSSLGEALATAQVD